MPTIKRAPRLVTSLPVTLSEGRAHYIGDIRNLSCTGLCLHPRKVFSVGTQLHLVFGQPPRLPAISADGVVRWAEEGKGVGVEITSISANDHEALLRFLTSQLHREQP